MKQSAWLTLALALAVLPAGCVTRRYVITSDPPGAIVYRDGQPIGATPVEESFIYYGNYHFRLVKDGYEPLDVDQKMATPWYEYIGADFISENFVPFWIRDKQEFCFRLQPLQQVSPDDLKRRAQQLRERGKLIQPPPGLVLPPRRPNPPPAPPGPTVLPPPEAGSFPVVPPPSLPPPVPAPAPGITRPISPPSTSP
jgi:hypothetical protein